MKPPHSATRTKAKGLEGLRGAVLEVEGLHTLRPLVPPVGQDNAEHLDRRMLIAIGGVMVVEAGIELDAGAGSGSPRTDVLRKAAPNQPCS